MTARISIARPLIAAGALIAAIALALALSGEPAGAAFPGKNGKVAFGRCLKAGQEGVFAVKSDGEGLRKLTGKGRQPSWSSNGNKIAYTRATKGGVRFGLSAIYKMKANGNKQRRLTKGNRGDTSPSWSPNGKKIVFARLQLDGSTFDIYVMKANGRKVRRLTKDGNFKYGPVWSPNGKMIAFDNDLKIYTMKANGKQKRAVNADTPAGVVGYQAPAWSPDGTEIVVEGNSAPGETAGIYKIDADGANPVELAKAGKSSCDYGRTDSQPDWQPR